MSIKITSDDYLWVDVDWTLLVPVNGAFMPTVPNSELIDWLRHSHKQGKRIIVWTSNSKGKSWAEEAIKICDIEDIVEDCYPKPKFIVDDDDLHYSIISPMGELVYE